MIRSLYDWLTLRDYDASLNTAFGQIASRYARGNVLIQSGSALDEDELVRLSVAADEAMVRLRKSAPRNA
ncbi:MAG: hypothetical protein H7841_16965 [Magnetospirillum sp. WYHS-4]